MFTHFVTLKKPLTIFLIVALLLVPVQAIREVEAAPQFIFGLLNLIARSGLRWLAGQIIEAAAIEVIKDNLSGRERNPPHQRALETMVYNSPSVEGIKDVLEPFAIKITDEIGDQTVKVGKSALSLQNMVLTDPNNEEILTGPPQSGEITVRESFLPWDLNGDGVVDILDLVEISACFKFPEKYVDTLHGGWKFR